MYISNLLETIITDFRQPVTYLIPSIFVSAVITALYVVIYQCWIKERYPKRRAAAWAFFFSYALVIAQTAFFSREPGSREQVSSVLFETWGHSVQAHAYFLENIIMFIPFGILTPAISKRMRKIHSCILTGFLCSCAIELSQLITQRGYCQLDDVVTNTTGTLVGWLMWKCFLERKKK